MSGKTNQRRGKQFELKVVEFINELTPKTGIVAEHLKRYDYGQSQPDIVLKSDKNSDLSPLDCKYTITYFSCKEKLQLLEEALTKYGTCGIVLGQLFGKKKLHSGNITVLRLMCLDEKNVFYIECPLSDYLLYILKTGVMK